MNIASDKLTFDEKKALKFGLAHSIAILYVKKIDIFACFETIYQSINSRLLDKRTESKLIELIADLSNLAQP